MNRSAKWSAALALLLICAGAKPPPVLAKEGAARPDIAEPGKPASPDAEACTGTQPAADDAGPQDQIIADAQATFALDLLRAVSANSKDGTISVSPVGIAAVFSGLALGADETMRAAITSTLRLPAADETGLAKLRAALRLLEMTRGASPLQGADALFVDHKIGLKPGIAELLQSEARIPLRSVALDTQEGVAAINGFVSDTTKGLIPTILDKLPPRTALVAVNAFRFKDCWRIAFDPGDTRKQPFRKLDGSQIEVPMMQLDGRPLAHAVTDRFATVDLAYRNAAFSLTLVTTKDEPAGLDAFAQAAELLAGDRLTTGPVDLTLPTFGAENSHELLPVLAGLGLKAGLDSPKALSGFADGIDLSAVQQKTLVAIDEKGTVAAAATAAVMIKRAFHIKPPVVRIAFDKPFVFALRHRPTGLVLMAGYVGEPKPPPEATAH